MLSLQKRLCANALQLAAASAWTSDLEPKCQKSPQITANLPVFFIISRQTFSQLWHERISNEQVVWCTWRKRKWKEIYFQKRCLRTGERKNQPSRKNSRYCLIWNHSWSNQIHRSCMHQTFSYNDSAMTYFTGEGFAKCFADGGVDWRNSLGFYRHVGKGKWLDGLWNKKKSLWEGTKYKCWTGKILLQWRFDLSENRMSWTVLAVPVTYPSFCLWRDMCHICFVRSWAIWAPASLLKLFLLPCSSSFASNFSRLTLADVDCKLTSDLSVQWLFMTRSSSWLECQGHTNLQTENGV